MTHELKIFSKFFEPICDGIKCFEIRKDDRPYQVGDILILRETDGHIYTGRKVRVAVTYILRDCNYNKKGFVTLGIKLLDNAEQYPLYIRKGNISVEDIEKIVRHSNFITVASDMMPKIEFINNWISCEDRLPIDKGPVLCYAQSVTGEGYVYIIGLLRNGKFWFMQSDGELLSFPCLCLEVTHWMPLPEPPKTNDNEEE